MRVKSRIPDPISVVKPIPGLTATFYLKYNLKDKTIYWSIIESSKKTEGSFTPTVETVDIKTPDGWTVELTPDDWKDIVTE